jgi:hypothetical protein
VGSDGRRLYEALRSGRFVLVTPPGFAPADIDGQVDVLPLQAGIPRLVRPDGYVGWAGDDTDGLSAALRTWGALGPDERSNT